jgi:hypothetical protein
MGGICKIQKLVLRIWKEKLVLSHDPREMLHIGGILREAILRLSLFVERKLSLSLKKPIVGYRLLPLNLVFSFRPRIMQSLPFLLQRTQPLQIRQIQVRSFNCLHMEYFVVIEKAEFNFYIWKTLWRSGFLIVELEFVLQFSIDHTSGGVSVWSGRIERICLLAAFFPSPPA